MQELGPMELDRKAKDNIAEAISGVVGLVLGIFGLVVAVAILIS